MAFYLDSIIANGQAELGNLSGWSTYGVTIATTGAGRHFRIQEGGYMQQHIGSVLFSRPSAQYLLKISHRRMQEKDPLDISVDALVHVRFNYDSGKEDVVTIPLGGYNLTWQDIESVYDHASNDLLKDIVLTITNTKAAGGILVDKIQMIPSDSYLAPAPPEPGDNYEKFRENSILYGLEANLPELG